MVVQEYDTDGSGEIGKHARNVSLKVDVVIGAPACTIIVREYALQKEQGELGGEIADNRVC